jgi:predicted aldo/keto reductase-like oxidoreductase
MKRKPTQAKRQESLQAIIDYLIENGVTEFNTNTLIHTNLSMLGVYRSINDEVRDKHWDKAWDAVELYVSGDMW